MSGQGKLQIYVTKWEEDFTYKDKSGFRESGRSKEKAEDYHCRLGIDLYNSSSQPKIMRNIIIDYSREKKGCLYLVPHDDEKTKRTSYTEYHTDVTPINIPPKTALHYELCQGLYGEEKLVQLWDATLVKLCFIDEKGRSRNVAVASLDYDKYFAYKSTVS